MKKANLFKKVAAGVSAAALLITPCMIESAKGGSFIGDALIAEAAAPGTANDIVNNAKSCVGLKRDNKNVGCYGSGDWCALFATKMLFNHNVEVPCKDYTYCSELVYDYLQQGRFHGKSTRRYTATVTKRSPSQDALNKAYDASYIPKPGDLIFYDWDPSSDPGPDHVGIVKSVSGTTVYTIEGNRGGSEYVLDKQVDNSSSLIYGYVTPNYSGSKTCTLKVTSPLKSRERAVEEAVARLGNSYTYSIDLVQDVLKASGTYNFGDANTRSISTFRKGFEAVGAFKAKGTYNPRRGDIILINTDSNPDADKVGIVTGRNGSLVSAIAVNQSNHIAEVMKSVSANSIIGYLSPYYQFEDYGDVDLSGDIDDNDLTMLKKAILGDIKLSQYQFKCADVSVNGSLNASDLSKMISVVANSVVYKGNDKALSHQLGRVSGTTYTANVSQDKSGFMSYGPYKPVCEAGSKVASFYLAVDNCTADNNRVASIDVYDSTSGRILASKDITRKDFIAPEAMQEFSLGFTAPNATDKLEYRVQYYDNVFLKMEKITVKNRQC